MKLETPTNLKQDVIHVCVLSNLKLGIPGADPELWSGEQKHEKWGFSIHGVDSNDSLKLKADRPYSCDYSTHRQTPWTDNDSSLLFYFRRSNDSA